MGGGKRWFISHNDIFQNAGAGIEANEDTRVVANYCHHNRQEGYACIGLGVVITDNEIAFNNPDDAVDPTWEGGGGKCWATTGLIVSHNYSRDNHGPGLWTDTDNQAVTYEYNDVENNWGGGCRTYMCTTTAPMCPRGAATGAVEDIGDMELCTSRKTLLTLMFSRTIAQKLSCGTARLEI